MQTETWLTLFEKPPFGPTKYLGKFGCKVSLETYLHFNPVEGEIFIGTVELPKS